MPEVSIQSSKIPLIICFRFLALLISTALIAVLIRPVISEYYVSRQTENPLSSALIASQITNEDARYHYLLGRLYRNGPDKHDLTNVIVSYQKSLHRDPAKAFAWIALSKAYRDSGNHNSAEYAIKRAVAVDRANPKVIWEAGMFYLTDEALQQAAAQFRHYLLLMPSEQEDVYTIFQSAGVQSAFILSQVLPPEYQFYSRYFKFLIAYDQKETLSEVWERRSLWHPAKTDYLAYCDLLTEKGLVRDAQGVWAEFVRGVYPESIAQDLLRLIFNGDFEYPMQNGGFDWKTGNAEGVEVFVDKDIRKSGTSSLTARFSGKTNPGIYLVQQPVAVEPKHPYLLSAQIRTDHLTTHNGILLEALSQNCPYYAAKSEVVTGTTDWRPLELEFTAPAGCSLIKVGIKREHSEKFDNKISGTAWIDDVRMEKITGKN